MTPRFVGVFINLESDVAKRESMVSQLEKSGAAWLRQEGARGRAIPDDLRESFDFSGPDACELLEGIPAHQVIRFQVIAPTRAEKMVIMVTTLVSTSPLPIVLATAVPYKAPIRLKTAARAIA